MVPVMVMVLVALHVPVYVLAFGVAVIPLTANGTGVAVAVAVGVGVFPLFVVVGASAGVSVGVVESALLVIGVVMLESRPDPLGVPHPTNSRANSRHIPNKHRCEVAPKDRGFRGCIMIPFYYVRSMVTCHFPDFYTRRDSNCVTASSHRRGNALFFSGDKSARHVQMDGTFVPTVFLCAPEKMMSPFTNNNVACPSSLFFSPQLQKKVMPSFMNHPEIFKSSSKITSPQGITTRWPVMGEEKKSQFFSSPITGHRVKKGLRTYRLQSICSQTRLSVYCGRAGTEHFVEVVDEEVGFFVTGGFVLALALLLQFAIAI
jgi:hypothetical protein